MGERDRSLLADCFPELKKLFCVAVVVEDRNAIDAQVRNPYGKRHGDVPLPGQRSDDCQSVVCSEQQLAVREKECTVIREDVSAEILAELVGSHPFRLLPIPLQVGEASFRPDPYAPSQV